MKNNHWITLIVGIAIALGIYALPAVTQSQQAAQQDPIPYLVAVIDIAQVIKNHPEFMKRQEDLQKQVNEAEAVFGKRQQAIVDKRKALDASPTLKPGSPQHQQMLDEIASEVTEFEKDTKNLQRKFALENSKIMYDTYQNIKGTIQKYAVSKGIAQVTDYRDFEPNPADPQTVAEDMDQRLVWFNPRLDITKFIISQIYADRGMPMPQLDRSQAQLAGGTAGGAAPAARATNATAPAASMQTPQR